MRKLTSRESRVAAAAAPPTLLPGIQVNAPYTEVTFALVKSHIVTSGKLGLVLEPIISAGLTIAVARRIELTGEQIVALYHAHVRKSHWNHLAESVHGPVVVMALAGRNAVAAWRELLGDADPVSASPGTLRSLYGSHKLLWHNVAHGSDSLPAARRELGLFFRDTMQLYGDA